MEYPSPQKTFRVRDQKRKVPQIWWKDCIFSKIDRKNLCRSLFYFLLNHTPIKEQKPPPKFLELFLFLKPVPEYRIRKSLMTYFPAINNGAFPQLKNLISKPRYFCPFRAEYASGIPCPLLFLWEWKGKYDNNFRSKWEVVGLGLQFANSFLQ